MTDFYACPAHLVSYTLSLLPALLSKLCSKYQTAFYPNCLAFLSPGNDLLHLRKNRPDSLVKYFTISINLDI